MKQFLKIPLTLFLLLLCTFWLNAQTPYFYNSDGTHGVVNDKNWNITTLKLDEEFTDETSTKTRWKYYPLGHSKGINADQYYLEGDLCYDNYVNCVPYNFNSNHNHTFNTTTGTMTLTSRWESPVINTYYIDATYTRQPKSYSISTGTAISQMAYKYGFFEARFKVNRAPGQQCKGLGQCFWLWGDYNDYNPIVGVPSKQNLYSEIDIAENDPMKGMMTSNCHYQKNSGDLHYMERNVDDCINEERIAHSDHFVNQTEWHTYSLEWTPTEMNTYYDNRLVRHMEYPASLFDYMNIILDIEGALTDKGNQFRFCNEIQPGITNLPFNFEIDFVKVYQLKMEGCGISFNETNYDFSKGTYTYDVKNDITLGLLGSNSASVPINTGQKVSLRAVEYISLEDGFEVDASNGTEFFATTNGECNN
jgi:hypothetical protein